MQNLARQITSSFHGFCAYYFSGKYISPGAVRFRYAELVSSVWSHEFCVAESHSRKLVTRLLTRNIIKQALQDLSAVCYLVQIAIQSYIKTKLNYGVV